MPIKPENKSRYPSNWNEIRSAILNRAGHACEKCKVPNGSSIVRGIGESANTFMDMDGYVFDADSGTRLGRVRHSDYEGTGKWTKIVLTIAHMDHVPENCDMNNLRAWCQRCHLRYDAEHHARNAAITRKSRKAIADLFD